MFHKLKDLLNPGKTLSQKVVRSTFWVGTFKITERILRFVRTIIVARLLSPSDFGLFGLACLAMSILQTFSETGIKSALIQRKDNTEKFLDTAWTINLLRNATIFLLLFFGAPLIAKFFNNLSAIPLIRLVGLTLFTEGLTNIGTVYFIKELDFRKQFLLQISKTLTNILVTVPLAFVLKNAWALVWGYLTGNTISCIISYVIHPYRPKLQFDLPKAKELLHFGKWIFGSSILIFLITQGDDILVGKVLGLAALGFYQMAYAISNLPATEITHLISQVTFPAYSKLQDNIPKLREAYLKVLQVTAFISFPVAGLIFVLAPDFTKLFLGEKWMPMVAAMQVLCIFGLTRSFGATTGPLFQAVGKPIILTKLATIQLLMMVSMIYPLTKQYGIFGTAISVVIPNFITQIFSGICVLRILKCKHRLFLKPFLFPLGSVAMVFFLLPVFINSGLSTNVARFFNMILLSMVSYLGITYLFYRFFGYDVWGIVFKLLTK